MRTTFICKLAWVTAAALMMTACGSAGSTPQPDTGSSIEYGLTLQPSGIDPHINASSELSIPLRSVYDTLVYRTPGTGAFVPGLASAWEISTDGLTYSFQLRQDVRFHDGTPFNAQAVAANLDRITDPATASQKALFMLGPYASHEVVDDYTIRIHLTEPYAPLLDSLSQVYLGMASPSALSEFGTDRYQFHQVGTGPYRMVDYLPGDRITLERNPDYAWGPSFVQPSNNAPQTITFRFFEDPAARSLALEGSDVQVIGELLPTDARNLAATGASGVLPVAIPGQPLQFFMNTTAFPTDNEAVRQALLYGLNRDAIIDAVFQRFSPVAWGPLSASTEFYAQSVAGRYAYDPEQAARLLDGAGLADSDGNGVRDFGGSDVTLNVLVPPWGLIPQVAQIIQQQYRELGLNVTLQQVPSRTALLEALDAGDFNLGAYYEFGLDPAFLERYFTTAGPNNWTGYADPALDALLTQASRETDGNARASLYAQAQAQIMDHALILPIRDYVNLNGYNGVSDLRYDAYGWSPLLQELSVGGAPAS